MVQKLNVEIGSSFKKGEAYHIDIVKTCFFLEKYGTGYWAVLPYYFPLSKDDGIRIDSQMDTSIDSPIYHIHGDFLVKSIVSAIHQPFAKPYTFTIEYDLEETKERIKKPILVLKDLKAYDGKGKLLYNPRNQRESNIKSITRFDNPDIPYFDPNEPIFLNETGVNSEGKHIVNVSAFEASPKSLDRLVQELTALKNRLNMKKNDR